MATDDSGGPSLRGAVSDLDAPDMVSADLRPTPHPVKDRSYERFGETQDRPRRLRAQIFGPLAVASGLVYLALLPGGLNPDAPLVGAAFVFAELACLSLFVLATANVWSLRFKPPTGLPTAQPTSVDVFITVCGEPMSVVERALASAAELQWEGPLGVYVLDDGGDPRVEARARELGFTYLSRPAEDLERVHAKAGNLNFGLSRSSGDLVFTLDADHLVRPQALQPLAGYMRFERVAFVQSKQTFIVPPGDPFNSQDPVFYDAVQLGFDNDDTAISCGSGVLYRRAALDEIGGFAEWNLVEDLTTSYELHSHGWKSFYYPYPVTAGLAPANIREVLQQRGQWATDTMRLFFWDNPFFKKGLSRASRLNHAMIGLSYLWAGFLVPVFFLIPLWTYLTGTPLLVDHEFTIVFVRIVYFLLFAVAAEYLFRGRLPGKQFQFLAGLFPLYIWGTLRALVHPRARRPGYRVNNAALSGTRRGPLWLALLPQMLVFLANATLPFYAIFRGTANPWVIAANVLVSAFALWTLWPVLDAGFRHRSDSLAIAGLSPDERG